METIEMRHDIPAWAKRRVTPEKHSFFEVRRLHRRGRAEIQLPDLNFVQYLPVVSGAAASSEIASPYVATQIAENHSGE